MFRRVMAATVGALALSFLVAVPALAQDSPGTTEATTIPEDDGDPEVGGATTARSGNLPITDGDIGGGAVVGLGLTGAGVALVVGARRRRTQTEPTA